MTGRQVLGGRLVVCSGVGGGVGGSWADEYGALGVVYDVVADAAEERASNGVEPARADHNQLGLLRLRHAHDALTSVLEPRTRLAPNLVLYLHHTHALFILPHLYFGLGESLSVPSLLPSLHFVLLC